MGRAGRGCTPPDGAPQGAEEEAEDMTDGAAAGVACAAGDQVWESCEDQILILYPCYTPTPFSVTPPDGATLGAEEEADGVTARSLRRAGATCAAESARIRLGAFSCAPRTPRRPRVLLNRLSTKPDYYLWVLELQEAAST